jgi:hypothetical protein
VREIWVLRPIRYFSILRNEVNNIASHITAKSWQKQGGGRPGYPPGYGGRRGPPLFRRVQQHAPGRPGDLRHYRPDSPASPGPHQCPALFSLCLVVE